MANRRRQADKLHRYSPLGFHHGLAAYNDEKAGYRDYRPLAVPATSEIVAELFGRTSFGLLFVERFFLPEKLRRDWLGSHVIALTEEEAKRGGCCPAAR